jgi:hypothetical protein
MALTKLERNEIFQAISASSLDAAECTLEQSDNEIEITHTSSGSIFKFTFIGTGHVDSYQVQSDVVNGHHLRFQTAREIDSVTPWITSWANEVKEAADAPDLWAEMRRPRELAIEVQSIGYADTSFTSDERRQIVIELEAVKEYVREELDLTREQMERIDESLSHAAEATERMGRKDWLLLFGGTILNLIVTDTVTPSVAGHIFTIVINALIHLFGGGPPQIMT